MIREWEFPNRTPAYNVQITAFYAKKLMHFNVFRVINRKECFLMKPQTISVSNVHIILGIVCSAKTVHFAKNVPILFI